MLGWTPASATARTGTAEPTDRSAALAGRLGQDSGAGRLLRVVAVFAQRKPLGAAAGVVLLLLIAVALAAPNIAPYDPLERYPEATLSPPSPRHLLGGDEIGRDVLSRIIWGSRISLWVGVVAVGLGVLSGAFLGILSGYAGGALDLAVQRVMDSLMAFPTLFLALGIVAVLGPSITNVMGALAIVIAPGTSRVVRGTTLSVKEQLYIEAARVVGCSHGRILLAHVLPNVAAPIIVVATVWLGNAIVAEASLSFLGVGTPPPTPSWGSMLSGTAKGYLEQMPWLTLFPGVAISVTVLAFNLLGDALRDVWDPRLRGGA